MPHSWPATTPRALSLKPLSCESLRSCTTTLSRTTRPLAPRHARGLRQRHVGFGNAADDGMDHSGAQFGGAEISKRASDGLERALHVGLDDQREFLAAGRLELAHHLLERAAHAASACRRLFA